MQVDLQKAFVPIGMVGEQPIAVAVNKEIPARNVAERRPSAGARIRPGCRIHASASWEYPGSASPGRWRDHGAWHRLRRIPFLDIGDGPHHHARVVRQLERLAVRYGRIGEAVRREHSCSFN
jgi:hypothetical protein